MLESHTYFWCFQVLVTDWHLTGRGFWHLCWIDIAPFVDLNLWHSKCPNIRVKRYLLITISSYSFRIKYFTGDSQITLSYFSRVDSQNFAKTRQMDTPDINSLRLRRRELILRNLLSKTMRLSAINHRKENYFLNVKILCNILCPLVRSNSNR